MEEIVIVEQEPARSTISTLRPSLELRMDEVASNLEKLEGKINRIVELAETTPVYDDTSIRMEIVQILTKRLPELWDKYIAYMNKTDMAQGRLKPDWPHFINWLKEYYV